MRKTTSHDEWASRPVAPTSKPDGEIRLSARDTQAFVQALLEPAPVNERLRETVQRYWEAIGV